MSRLSGSREGQLEVTQGQVKVIGSEGYKGPDFSKVPEKGNWRSIQGQISNRAEDIACSLASCLKVNPWYIQGEVKVT